MQVLLIEDNPGDARLIQEVSRDAGVQADYVHVTRVDDAVSQLAERTFDVILTDLGLPDSLGVETVERLHAAAPDTPLIVLTGSTSEEHSVPALRAGADDYLVKNSVQGEGLSRSLRYAVERKRSAVQAREAMREEARVVETLHRIGGALASELDVSAIVQTVTDESTELTGAAFGAFFYNVTDDAGEAFTLYALAGVPRAAFERFPMPRNTKIFDPTFRGETVVRSDDITKDERYGQNPPYRGMPEGHLPVRSYLAVPVTSRTGEPIGGLFFGHPDVGRFTERHEQIVTGIAGWAALAMDNAQLYEAERRARTEAEKANRAKSDFLATMSHELRTPLNAMIGYTDLWLMGLPESLPEAVLGQVDRLRLSAKHLLGLIEEILTFSRIEAAQETVELEEVGVIDLVQAAAGLVEPLAINRSLGFEVRVPVEDVRMNTDPLKVRQIVINLLSNAVKFTDDGKVAMDVRREGRDIFIVVEDTGDGISEDNLARIFEPFWQAPQAAAHRPAGTGLGLAVSRKLARLLGGDIVVESVVGRGSRFTLTLPIEPPPPVQDAVDAERTSA